MYQLIEFYKIQVIVLYYLQDGPDRAFVREELMHVSEDIQVAPDWVSEWK